MLDPDNLMDFAARTTTGAGEITLAYFGGAAVEFKGDGSEVTEADRAAEEYIRAAVTDAFPEDGILGEEGAAAVSHSGRRWIIDPIDGTRSFGSGVPLYGVLLTLEVDGSPQLGCCHFPVLRQTVVAAVGAGAWMDGKLTRVSGCDELAEARVVTSGLEYWRDWATEEGQRGWDELVRRSRFARTWGDGYGYILVATGRAEIMADPSCGAPWDYLPMRVILQEAGGRITAFGGEPVTEWSTVIASNGQVHAAAARCWTPPPAGDRGFQTDTVLSHRDSTV